MRATGRFPSRSRLLAVAASAALLIGVGTVALGVTQAAATAGGISGTVTSAATGAGLYGICVEEIGSGGSNYVLTAPNGTYSFTGLAAGSYTVEFSSNSPLCYEWNDSAGNYAPQWYKDQPSAATANAVTVIAGSTTSEVDAAMVAGGTISGTVTAASGGAPLTDVCVTVDTPGTTDEIAVVDTASNGTYSVTSLPTGSYDVEFKNCIDTGSYLTQWYHGQDSQASANVVSVTAGSTTSGIDAAMVAAGTISGTVTAASGGAPLNNICVAAFAPGTNNDIANGVGTGNGTYSINNLPTGSYDVEFSACSQNIYAPQWYDGQTSQSAANLVSVTAGSTTSGIDAAMAAPGTISGTVTIASSGAPLEGVCVFVAPAGTPDSEGYSTGTSSDGTWSMSGLAAGNYDVEFVNCNDPSNYHYTPGNFAPQWYDGQSSQGAANVVSVTAGSTTSGIDAAMVAGGTITGTVTAASSGAPLGGVCVLATPVGGEFPNSEAQTAADGAYSITSLAPGSYNIEFATPCGTTLSYTDQWYNDEPSLGLANPVAVTAGSTASGIDAAMVANSAPDAPSGVSGVSGNGQVAVSWTAPASDGGLAITQYAVTASPGGQTCVWTSGPLTCTVTGLTNGSPYTFTVTAANPTGSGPASSPSSAVTPATVPDAPSSVSGVPGDGQVVVSWTAPASDGGSAITAYTVRASPGGQTCSWTSGPLTCTVTGLTNGLPYTFTVTAANVVGSGPASSASPAVILSHCASTCPDWNPSSPYPASHPWYPPPADSRSSAIQGGANTG